MTYKLRFDRSKFLAFEILPAKLEAKLDEAVWSEFWKAMNAKFIDFSDNKNVTTPPDITCWFTDQLVLNENAYALLSTHLQPYGEFLPVSCEGVPYWVLHVTNMTGMDVVDEEKSGRLVKEGGYIDVASLSFKEEQVKEKLLFKTEYNGWKNIYCSEEFKKIVEEHRLQGLVFSADLAGVF